MIHYHDMTLLLTSPHAVNSYGKTKNKLGWKSIRKYPNIHYDNSKELESKTISKKHCLLCGQKTFVHTRYYEQCLV